MKSIIRKLVKTWYWFSVIPVGIKREDYNYHPLLPSLFNIYFCKPYYIISGIHCRSHPLARHSSKHLYPSFHQFPIPNILTSSTTPSQFWSSYPLIWIRLGIQVSFDYFIIQPLYMACPFQSVDFYKFPNNSWFINWESSLLGLIIHSPLFNNCAVSN